jgi:CBS domain-containing protein
VNRVLVSDIMTRQIATADPDTSLLECARRMVKRKIGSLVIVNGKKLAGFISVQDILWAIIKKSKEDLSKIKASEISPRKLITIQPDATLEEAVDKIRKYKFHRLPVVKNGEVLGMITLRDILNFYPELNIHLKEANLIMEESEKMRRLEDAKERVVFRDGICEECGSRDALYRVNGSLICSSCMADF